MHCLVTGGSGFIGSYLVERLVADGHYVTVLDNYSTGRRENLVHLQNHSRLKVYEVDIAGSDSIRQFFNRVDWLFHLAALADIVPSIQRPWDYFLANVVATARVLEAARSAGVSRFIYAASSSCYGIPDGCPTLETAPIKPMYPYAFTKYIAEQHVLHWNKIYKLSCVSLRLFNVFGPRSRTTGAYGSVFGVFLAQKLSGKPFTVVGDGTQTRDFTFVTDVVDAFVRAAESDIEDEVLNVGSGKTYSVDYLVSLLGGDVVHVPKRPGEPDCTLADTTKIRRLLGWAPKVSFEEGVRIILETIDYWRDAPVWTPEKIEVATREWFEFLGER